MSDDIVTRLRGYDFMRDGDIPDVIMSEAADEIERLRAEVSRLTILANLWESEFNAAVNALTEKAVRGE